MFESDDRRANIDLIFNARGGEARQIYFSRPEIAGDCQQMWMPEEGLKSGWQVRF